MTARGGAGLRRGTRSLVVGRRRANAAMKGGSRGKVHTFVASAATNVLRLRLRPSRKAALAELRRRGPKCGVEDAGRGLHLLGGRAEPAARLAGSVLEAP